MYNYYNQGVNPFAVNAPQQQQQQPQIDPMTALNMYQQFSGGGGAGASGAAGALASNPIGWIAAIALAQNVAHNKGIQAGRLVLKAKAVETLVIISLSNGEWTEH